MKKQESFIPEKKYFTLEEIALQWGCTLEDVESYVYDHKLLRLAVVTRYVEAFKQAEELTVKYINRELHVASNDEKRNRLYSSDRIAQEHGAVIWRSDQPEFLYLNFEYGGVRIGTNIYQTKNIRVKRSAHLIFSIFETEAGDGFEVCEVDSMSEINVGVANPVITRQERDRFVAEYHATPNTESGVEGSLSYSIEHRQLLTTVGLLTLALRQATKNLFKTKDGYDNKVMGRYFEEHYDGKGVTERNIPGVVQRALSLIKERDKK